MHKQNEDLQKEIEEIQKKQYEFKKLNGNAPQEREHPQVSTKQSSQILKNEIKIKFNDESEISEIKDESKQ